MARRCKYGRRRDGKCRKTPAREKRGGRARAQHGGMFADVVAFTQRVARLSCANPERGAEFDRVGIALAQHRAAHEQAGLDERGYLTRGAALERAAKLVEALRIKCPRGGRQARAARATPRVHLLPYGGASSVRAREVAPRGPVGPTSWPRPPAVRGGAPLAPWDPLPLPDAGGPFGPSYHGPFPEQPSGPEKPPEPPKGKRARRARQVAEADARAQGHHDRQLTIDLTYAQRAGEPPAPRPGPSVAPTRGKRSRKKKAAG